MGQHFEEAVHALKLDATTTYEKALELSSGFSRKGEYCTGLLRRVVSPAKTLRDVVQTELDGGTSSGVEGDLFLGDQSDRQIAVIWGEAFHLTGGKRLALTCWTAW
tara:strand:+ start:3052 stop:3369 length:318 start_codon:yes stop_codon:yes gene_type:complete